MDRYEFSGEEITLFFYKVATIFTPQLSRSFSLCLYLLLLGLLGGMIVHGPLLKLLSEETEFQVDRVGPEEVPVPTVSICRMVCTVLS